MNTSIKSLFIILLISFSSIQSFSQSDTTKTVIKDSKINGEISKTGNYKLKATTKAATNSSFDLKINKKLNTAAIDKNLKENRPNSKTQNFLLEELPEDRDIIGKKYWKNKDVTHKRLESNLSLGTVNSSTRTVKIECRDHSYVDGDRIRLYLNEQVISNNIGLKGNYYVFYINLEDGYNRIDFQALNQGLSGPNTAELKVYDDKGNLISAKEWNLPTGATATLGIIKK
ncbi:MAG: hypothetical protein HKP59_07320 [Lutibacter sp.]|uniref:hypothetical protein n=1 Tax=Lutibacter sp. TaxID=1925666 RepID=UPI0018059369|nr:hypothetical protein [Lutibacter sp.]MBT8317419.1 hypothetical protein [Lutibacter sp.]NNJ58278.1 hypothetical protein [Lutibacter sp.]